MLPAKKPNRLLTATTVTLTFLCAACTTTPSHDAKDFAPKPGDFLFQDVDCGPLCDAIETVTQGIDGAHFSHVGMVAHVGPKGPLIIEAVNAGVVETPLADFLSRSADEDGHPKVLVGRLRESDRALIPKAITEAEHFLKKPYDDIYVIDDSSFYCSELLYEAFRKANNGVPIFPLAPMTFCDPATNKTFPAWVDYYAQLKHPIPEGEPGLNPGGISRSPRVEIVYAYGRPTGWSGSISR